MEYRILGYTSDGPTLNLDYRQFAYAGKFVMSSTGKSVAEADGEILGAIAFSPDHDDPSLCHLRYVTVRDDHQSEGIGATLLRFTADALDSEGYDCVTIAVNNPIAYRACYRAGFVFTGRETGIAELVLRYDPNQEWDETQYRTGLAVFRERDLPEDQQTVLERTDVPGLVSLPNSTKTE